MPLTVIRGTLRSSSSIKQLHSHRQPSVHCTLRCPLLYHTLAPPYDFPVRSEHADPDRIVTSTVAGRHTLIVPHARAGRLNFGNGPRTSSTSTSSASTLRNNRDPTEICPLLALGQLSSLCFAYEHTSGTQLSTAHQNTRIPLDVRILHGHSSAHSELYGSWHARCQPTVFPPVALARHACFSSTLPLLAAKALESASASATQPPRLHLRIPWLAPTTVELESHSECSSLPICPIHRVHSLHIPRNNPRCMRTHQLTISCQPKGHLNRPTSRNRNRTSARFAGGDSRPEGTCRGIKGFIRE